MRKIPNINTHIFKQPDLPWSLLSEEAKSMLGNYESLGVALSGTERSAMISYVDSEVESGNHYKKDYEIIFTLSGINSLVDYIGGKIATLVNAPIHTINGYTFDGLTQSIKSNFNPSIDGVNYTVNDFMVGVFVKQQDVSTWSFDVIYDAGSRLLLDYDIANTRYEAYYNANFTEGGRLSIVGGIRTKTLLQVYNGTNRNFYNDGVLITGNAFSPIGIASGNFSFGGSTGKYFKGILSNAILGAGIGFNPLDNNTNLTALLTSLGTLP